MLHTIGSRDLVRADLPETFPTNRYAEESGDAVMYSWRVSKGLI